MDRMIAEEHWGYYAFVLANNEVAEKGKIVCIDTGNAGIIVMGKTATGLIPIGIAMESFTGNGVKKLQVKLFREIQATYWDNDGTTPCAATDRGTLCYIKNNTTVSKDNTGRSTAGMILDVDATMGVLVHWGLKTF